MSRNLSCLVLILVNFSYFVASQSCGVSKIGKGNIIHGGEVLRGQFPWTAALLRLKSGGEYKYFCGGVLISANFVVSAAHCVLDKGRTVSVLAREVLIILGGHDLDQKFETGRETIPPIRIYVHPDWNPQVQSFDGDLSLFQLEQFVQFNAFIQPICWWQFSSEPPNNSGTVVGYGKSEDATKTHESVPKMIQVPIHSQENCFLSEPNLIKLSSSRTFCAGSGDGKGVCSGDSGGGLTVKINGVYYLRGIVSSSLIKDFACDVNNYAIFTNVLKYKDWIFGNSGIRPPIQSTTAVVFRPTQPPSINPPQTSQNYNECGIMSTAAGLIQGGRFTSQSQFPWMASVIISYSNFFLNASGVIISQRHIVTPGSAVALYNENSRYFSPIALHRVKIYLGSVSRNDRRTAINPVSINLHPSMKEVDDTPINNIALIVTEILIQFNDFVRPICQWTFNDELQYVSSSPFYSVGYGLDESGKVSNIRKYARVSIVDLKRCEQSFASYRNIFHETNAFCAQGSANESPCDFDDFLFVKYGDRWYLRGIVLLNFHFENFNTCNYNEPILFQDMAQHVRWIQRSVG